MIQFPLQTVVNPLRMLEKVETQELIPEELDMIVFRTHHQRCSIKKSVLKNFAKLTGKSMCWSFFFNKVTDLRPETLLKKRLSQRCFPVNFAIFLRTTFLQSASRRLILNFPVLETLFSRKNCTLSGAQPKSEIGTLKFHESLMTSH